MKAGDILFVKGKGPLASVIRFFDPGKYNHAAIAVSETHVLEAQYFTKARITPLYFEEYDVVDIGLTDKQREQVVHLGIEETGKWYDYTQILWYVIKRFFNIKGKNRFNHPNQLICSELIYDLLKSCDKIPKNSKLNIDVTPNQLYQYLIQLKSVDKVETNGFDTNRIDQ